MILFSKRNFLWLFIGVAAVLGVAVVLGIIDPVSGLKKDRYLRQRGGDLAISARERQEKLGNIWDRLVLTHRQMGRWPDSIDEVLAIQADIVSLLSPPKYANGSCYTIHFSALGADHIEVLVDDPGLLWPGHSGLSHGSPAIEKWRFVLLNSGKIVDRTEVDPRLLSNE